MFLNHLDLEPDTYLEYVQKYNNISAKAQTPNPRQRPPKGPDTTVYKHKTSERVEQK